MYGLVVSIGGSFLCLFLNYWVICIGRLIMAVGAGLVISSAPKYIEETVPEHVISKGFGLSANLAVNLAITLDGAVAGGLPTDPELLKTTEMWRVVYSIPIFFGILAIFPFTSFFKQESLIFLIRQKDSSDAGKLIAYIYP